MFLRIPTKKSTKNYSDEIIRLKEKLDKAAVVVIGAGAGLSAAAGFNYSRLLSVPEKESACFISR